MSRKLPLEVINKELSEKGFKLVSKYEDYKNLNSPIMIECVNGHKTLTTLKTVRLANFTCSLCVGRASTSENLSSIVIPEKKGHRVIGFDNASHKMGVAIYDDGKLVYYHLLQFNSGNAIHRLNKIRDLIEKEIIPNWKPDIIQIEGVQKQNSFATYDVLVKLHGIFEMACERYKIPIESTRSSQWRSHYAFNNRNRKLDKAAAIQRVKEMYNIDVNDDVAEAILIAKYRVDLLNIRKPAKLF